MVCGMSKVRQIIQDKISGATWPTKIRVVSNVE
jgi:hypothetical protein